MTKAIEKLNAQGIYVMYVYDALFCLPEQKYIVQKVMNKVILEEGVYTSIKFWKLSKKRAQTHIYLLEVEFSLNFRSLSDGNFKILIKL